MILNGWRLSDGKAFWMAETGEDAEGKTHTLAIVIQRENPESIRQLTGELDEGLEESKVHIDDPQEGLYLKLMLDGEGQTIFELGGGMDLPVTEFASTYRPEPIAWNAAEMAVENRQRKAVQERLRQMAD